MPGKYRNSIHKFLKDDNETIIGHLAIGITNHQLLLQQRISWNHQISYLKEALQYLPENWQLILEYPIPRRSKRIDIVLLAHDVIFVVEFKDKEAIYLSAAISQVEDYSLDIRDFHKQSATKTIIPIVWASEGKNIALTLDDNGDFVKSVLFANRANLAHVIRSAFEFYTNTRCSAINLEEWNNSEYLPTPTIIEAAQYLFAGQNVREISRSHAGSENLTRSYLINTEDTF
jgi:hypothetical protein